MKIAILIFIFIFSISCEKENRTQKPVFAGIVSENMYYKKFDPAVIIKVEWVCGEGIGSRSIDLLDDSINDLSLNTDLLDFYTFMGPSCCPPPMDCLPTLFEYTIKSLTDIEIAIYNETSSDMLLSYGDTLREGNRIDTITLWKNTAYLWEVDFPNTNGAWYGLKEDKYLGIRKGSPSQYKYGWIKIGNGDFNNLIFKEYAIEK